MIVPTICCPGKLAECNSPSVFLFASRDMHKFTLSSKSMLEPHLHLELHLGSGVQVLPLSFENLEINFECVGQSVKLGIHRVLVHTP